MIEDAALKYLGIHPEVIERADAIVERVCEAHGIDSDEEVWPYVLDRFMNRFGTMPYGRGTFTDELIAMFFAATASALEESGIDEDGIDYYVDGMCSSFSIDGEEA